MLYGTIVTAPPSLRVLLLSRGTTLSLHHTARFTRQVFLELTAAVPGILFSSEGRVSLLLKKSLGCIIVRYVMRSCSDTYCMYVCAKYDAKMAIFFRVAGGQKWQGQGVSAQSSQLQAL